MHDTQTDSDTQQFPPDPPPEASLGGRQTRGVRPFLPRYPYWWDREFQRLGLGPSATLLVVSVLRSALAEKGAYLVTWGNKSAAKAVGVSSQTSSHAKKVLRKAGLITLFRAGTFDGNNPDIYDVTPLCWDKKPKEMQ